MHGDAAGFMAAILTPGMRAVSITIATDSGAGGFILPNDRVDVILTRKFNQTEPPHVVSQTILSDVRVLAVDQTYKQDKDTKTVIGQVRDAGTDARPGRGRLPRGACGRPVAGAASAGRSGRGREPRRQAEKRQREFGPVSVIRYGMAPNAGKLLLQEKPQ